MSSIRMMLGDRIQVTTILIVLCFIAVLGLESQSAASYPSYLLAVVMILSFSHWRDVFETRLAFLVLVLLGYLCLSSLWSDPFAIREFVGIVTRAFLVLFFLVAVAETQLRGLVQRWLGRSLATIGAIAAMASIANHLAGNVPGARLAGLGQLDNPVVAGLVFGAVFILILDVILSDDQRTWRIVASLGGLILLTAVVMTGSRNAWGSVAIGSIVLVGATKIADRQKYLAFLAMIFVVGLAALAAVLTNVELSARLFPKGDSFRFDIWVTVLGSINGMEWIFGRGILTPDGLQVDEHILSHPHSMYLAALVQGGLIALVLVFAVILSTLAILLAGYDQRSARLGLGILAMAITSYLFDGHEIIDKVGETWFLLWLPVAIALGLSWTHRLGGAVRSADGR